MDALGGERGFSLSIGIPAAGEPEPVRISFPVGGTTATESGSLAVLGMDVYVLRASAGQILDVQADWSGGQVLLEIWGADGTVLKRYVDGAQSWSGDLASTQDYFILVSSYGGAGAFSLTVTVR